MAALGREMKDYMHINLQMRPPSYPPQAAKAGIRGTVYLVLRIDREGTVDDVFVELVGAPAPSSEESGNG